ncbi:hypothetical protein BSY238_1334 [Methyloversatilis sp. RAC08]|jgi:hypothetical protein|nr:hypothetical protein BSY238_1334 [Methyloversatilis sp. RAC08]
MSRVRALSRLSPEVPAPAASAFVPGSSGQPPAAAGDQRACHSIHNEEHP